MGVSFVIWLTILFFSVSPGLDNSLEKQSRYVYGQRVEIYDEEEHELVENKSTKDIKREALAKHVCAMLNSGKLTTVLLVCSMMKVIPCILSTIVKYRFEDYSRWWRGPVTKFEI